MNNHIHENAKTLKLTYIRENHENEIIQAGIQNLDHETFLNELLEKEVESRKDRSIARRIKTARFPFIMAQDDFKLDHYEPSLQQHIRSLQTMSFVKNRENVILVGNPGVGKTALAIRLGYKLCLSLKKVLFLNTTDLLIQIKEAMSQNQILKYKRRFESYDLVILDELGFVSFDKASGEILFNLLSSRNQKGSTIITSNLSVDKWNEIIHDPVMTTAIVDRLAYRSHLIDMSGESYRVKSTIQWQEEYFKELGLNK